MMTIEEILANDSTFRYQLLSRMQSDCEYFFGYGNRNESQLWAGGFGKQVSHMKAIWNSFADDQKPEWLSYEKIMGYEWLFYDEVIEYAMQTQGHYE